MICCDLLFQGEWLNDMLHGTGTYRHMSGDVYSGQFHENKMQGIGKYVAADGVSFSGRFNNGILVEYDVDSRASASSSTLDVFDLKDCKDRFGAVAAADAAGATSSTVHILHERQTMQQQNLHEQHQQLLQREEEEGKNRQEQMPNHMPASAETGFQESSPSSDKVHNPLFLVSADTAYHAEASPSPRALSNLSPEVQTPNYKLDF